MRRCEEVKRGRGEGGKGGRCEDAKMRKGD